ncbi:MAG: tRNA pseudouridine(55) synthase TruB [Alphaproteobacteria bacterium]
MARRGLPISGWLVIDKPRGLSSAAIVGIAKRATGAAKVGHGGTLDPLATGILPLAFGEATKTVAYVMDARKQYGFTVRWGEARDTDDAEGQIVAESDARPTRADILSALPRFTGRIRQVPPNYSAIKVGGRRAYKLARADQSPELAAREVEVYGLELIGQPDADHADFMIDCGKGTYIRSLARDLAQDLGTVGHTARLRRHRAGPFIEKQAISLEELGSLGHSAAHSKHLFSVETVLDDIPALALTEMEAERLRCGQSVEVLRTEDWALLDRLEPGAVVRARWGDRTVAIIRVEGNRIRSVRGFNL